jgi:hypothetical protein
LSRSQISPIKGFSRPLYVIHGNNANHYLHFASKRRLRFLSHRGLILALYGLVFLQYSCVFGPWFSTFADDQQRGLTQDRKWALMFPRRNCEAGDDWNVFRNSVVAAYPIWKLLLSLELNAQLHSPCPHSSNPSQKARQSELQYSLVWRLCAQFFFLEDSIQSFFISLTVVLDNQRNGRLSILIRWSSCPAFVPSTDNVTSEF